MLAFNGELDHLLSPTLSVSGIFSSTLQQRVSDNGNGIK